MSRNSVLKSQTNQIWEQLNWEPSKEQLNQFTYFQELLRESNKKINLTRLIEGNDFWISQILDSLWPITNDLQRKSKHLNIIDVGTGCGLPGLAIAIALPHSSITLVDSMSKKTNIIKEIVKELNLNSRVYIRTERIELTGQDLVFRGKYDLGVARAVAPGAVLAEYLIPLLKPSGQAILYKGQWKKTEQQALFKALDPLQANIKKIDTLQLPEKRGIRHVIRLAPIGKCPSRFPRSVGIPYKKPLED